MSGEAMCVVPLSDERPLVVARKFGKTIAMAKDESLLASVLPFSLRTCEVVVLHADTPGEAADVDVTAREWPVKVWAKVSLDSAVGCAHWLVFQAHRSEEKMASKCFLGSKEGLGDVFMWVKSLRLEGLYDLYVASEPFLSCESITTEIGSLCLQEEKNEKTREVNERVLFGDSASDVAHALDDFLCSFFIYGMTSPTAVFWPPQLTHPVNIHYSVGELRVAEHSTLLLPFRPLLHFKQRLKKLSAADKLCSTTAAASLVRSGELWEKHLASNVHARVTRNSPIAGGELFLTSGTYDYYHYRVDGFRDDGWGCAYRSLQTVLSWFQYEGLMNCVMPSIRAIQEVLVLNDPDKMNRKGFVGSKDWIGSFEVMIVIQHYIPGIECTIKRMESGLDLDTDPSIQQLLVNHFGRKRACPIMIGGSSYAHTILGVDINLSTMEARYLIADPHYSSGKTDVKTVINKGYVGWKEAKKFFESGSWYNICIPQLASYDPR